jgi:uncharacterized protein YqcC (DUF446 family)
MNVQHMLDTLDAIEAEMRNIGFWAENPPDLSGDAPITFVDAPSFEHWLQTVFLPNARAAVAADALPTDSQVGLMAMRQYDYHTHVPAAQTLLRLLCEFDALVRGQHNAG